MARSSNSATLAPAGFRPLPLLLAVLALLLLISLFSRWYAAAVALPRYCAQPEQTLHRLAAVIGEERPAGDGSRREFIVAAKLKYLLPAQADEADADYLRRLQRYLADRCR